METPFRFLSSLLSLVLLFSGTSCAVETSTETAEEPAAENTGPSELFLALTEKTSKSLSFPLTKEQAA